MTPSEVLRVMTFVYADYGVQVTPETPLFKKWCALFSHLELSTAKAAASLLAHRPVVSHSLLTASFSQAVTEVTAPDIAGGEAFDMALRIVRAKGSYGWVEEVRKLPATVRTAVERFGYLELCNMQTSDMPTIRAQFIKIYDSIRNRAGQTAAMSPQLQSEVSKRRQIASDNWNAQKDAVEAKRLGQQPQRVGDVLKLAMGGSEK